MATDSELPNKNLRGEIPHGEILHGDNLPLLKKIASESVSLIYVDPPFNTGRTQSRKRIKVRAVTDEKTADRIGFGDKLYAKRSGRQFRV